MEAANFGRFYGKFAYIMLSQATIDLLVSVALALIMFGIGLTMTWRDIANIFTYPKAFFLALASQMLALPVIAFVIAIFAPLSPAIKVGLVILAASPGGSTSGFITFLFRGNVALSLSLTAVNSFLTLFSIPLVVNFALGYFMHSTAGDFQLPFWNTVQHVFLISLLPVFFGILVNRLYPEFALRLEKNMRYILMALLGGVFSIMLFGGKNNGGAGLTLADVWLILPYALLLNVACLFFGYGFLFAFRLSHADRLTAAIESGVHNTALAFLIAGSLLHNNEMVKPILLYALFSFWTAVLFSYGMAWLRAWVNYPKRKQNPDS